METYKTTIQIPDADDLEIEVEIKYFYKSHSCESDDPDSVIFGDCWVTEDNGPYHKGDKVYLTMKDEAEISDRYFFEKQGELEDWNLSKNL